MSGGASGITQAYGNLGVDYQEKLRAAFRKLRLDTEQTLRFDLYDLGWEPPKGYTDEWLVYMDRKGGD